VAALGYVAFVDEAVHHATPWFGHRYVTPSEFKAYLERKHRAEFDEIVKADKAFQTSRWPAYVYSFSTYVDKSIISEGDIAKWQAWLALANVDESETSKRRREKKYTRDDFKATMLGDEFDRMLEDVGGQPRAERQSAGAGGWQAASIPKAGLSAVRPQGKPPLTRTASSADLTKDWPAQLPEEVPRRFIRAWVRAVPASFADKIRGS